MVKKKNWLKSGSLKLVHGPEPTDLNISWSSSSSDVEHYDKNSKYRQKFKVNSKIQDFNRACVLQNREISPIRCDNASTMESPVVGRSLNDLSPTFNEKSSDEVNKSPVIGKNIKVKNWKKRKKKLIKSWEFPKYESVEAKTEDSDIFSISSYSSIANSQKEDIFSISQLTTNTSFIGIKSPNEIKICEKDNDETGAISQCSNDIFSQCANLVNIDVISTQHKSLDVQQTSISQYLSSQESQIATFTQNSPQHNPNDLTKSGTNTTCTPLSTGTVFHYLKRPVKKRYKKDGLAKQLQKALQNKQASVSIWKHEIYLKQDHCDFLYLRVNKRFTEYQNIIFECNLANNHAPNNAKCLVVLNNILDETESYPQYLKIYKPYSVSDITYLKESSCCYYNVSKILFLS